MNCDILQPEIIEWIKEQEKKRLEEIYREPQLEIEEPIDIPNKPNERNNT